MQKMRWGLCSEDKGQRHRGHPPRRGTGRSVELRIVLPLLSVKAPEAQTGPSAPEDTLPGTPSREASRGGGQECRAQEILPLLSLKVPETQMHFKKFMEPMYHEKVFMD